MKQTSTNSISVIIPTCDRPAEFVREAVNSVLTQSRKPDEIILADNGRKPVDESNLPDGLNVHRMPPRVGPSRARNYGASVSTGNLIAFLDDDDFWDKDFLKNAERALKDEGADCVYGRIDILRDGTQRKHSLASQDKVNINALLQKASGFGGINFLVKREMYRLAGGFDESLKVSEDRALAVEILKNGGKIAIAPDAVTVMREHDLGRQRYSDMARFGFIWKYRKDLGPVKLVKRSVSILTKVLRRRIRFWLAGNPG